MMASFRLEGVEEFQKKLRTVEKRAPDRIIDKLDEVGRDLRKAARANTPKGKTGNLRKGYRLTQVEKVQGSYQKGLYNRAPHHHLVNNGHRKVSPSGKELGWTEGLFYIEKTMAEQEETIANELENWLDELFQELSR